MSCPRVIIPESRKRPSIFRNIIHREYGFRREDAFARSVSCFFDIKHLLHYPEIVSPHRKSISSLAMEANSGRFLLAGSTDGTISIYDISKWGSGQEKDLRRSNLAAATAYYPVARSVMVPAVPDILRLPAGHSSSISYAQWYPTDAGVFLSGSSDGTLLVWDTSRMNPVLRIHPFGGEADEDFRAATWISADLRSASAADSNNNNLLVAGSYSHVNLKLVDIRSGSASHQLVGHQRGITCVQWSPASVHVLASGSRDGCIRLWDIRKSGSRACITVMDKNQTLSSSLFEGQPGYAADYSHLRKEFSRVRHVYTKNKVSKKRRREGVAPNNYDHLQSQSFDKSHNGRVSALKFLGYGHCMVSVSGKDGEMLLWDMRYGQAMPNKFIAPGTMQATAPNQRHVALLTTWVHGGSNNSDTTDIWVAYKGQILGFSAEGGIPRQILQGHLSHVTSLENMEPGSRLLSGGADGMVLCWGQLPSTTAMGPPTSADKDKDNW